MENAAIALIEMTSESDYFLDRVNDENLFVAMELIEIRMEERSSSQKTMNLFMSSSSLRKLQI